MLHTHWHIYAEEGCSRNVAKPAFSACHQNLKGDTFHSRVIKHIPHFWTGFQFIWVFFWDLLHGFLGQTTGWYRWKIWGYPDVWHPARIGQNGSRASLLSTGGVFVQVAVRPSRELTYPTWGIGKSSWKVPWEKDMLVPRSVVYLNC